MVEAGWPLRGSCCFVGGKEMDLLWGAPHSLAAITFGLSITTLHSCPELLWRIRRGGLSTAMLEE